MIQDRKFKAQYTEARYYATATEIRGIISILKDTSLPSPFIKETFTIDKWILPYSDIVNIIKNGRHLYYVVYSDRDNGYGTEYSTLIYGNSKKSVRECIMKGHRAARGCCGWGRCIVCLLEVSKMHPYEIAQMLNNSYTFNDEIDEHKWYASYCKDYPGSTHPDFIESLCREHEEKYGESVDDWKLL